MRMPVQRQVGDRFMDRGMVGRWLGWQGRLEDRRVVGSKRQRTARTPGR